MDLKNVQIFDKNSSNIDEKSTTAQQIWSTNCQNCNLKPCEANWQSFLAKLEQIGANLGATWTQVDPPDKQIWSKKCKNCNLKPCEANLGSFLAKLEPIGANLRVTWSEVADIGGTRGAPSKPL